MGTEPILPTFFKETSSSYSYDAKVFGALEQVLWDRMQSYAGLFGQTMVEHLARVSTHLYGTMKHLGYDEVISKNIAHAFRLHDAGKVLQDVSLWGLEDKPSEEIRKLRPEHTNLGVTLLDDVLKEFPHLKDHPHTGIIASFMKYHHERINGKGPQGLMGDHLGDILEIGGIVDCVDGKSVLRTADKALPPNQIETMVKEKTAQALRDMTGLPAFTAIDKHKGEFRTDLLLKIIPYYEKKMGLTVLPPIA